MVAARRLLDPRGRRRAGQLLVEGPHALEQAIAGEARVVELFTTPDAPSSVSLAVAAAVSVGAVVRMVTPRLLARLADTVTPQGVVAVVALPRADLGGLLASAESKPRLVCLLADAADPGNAGTIVRTADAAGADFMGLGAGSVDIWSGKAVRASAGSVFGLPIVTDLDLPGAIADLQKAGLTVCAAAGDGAADLDDLLDAGELTAPTAWLFGNEARGLPESLMALADRRVRIRVRGQAESLNLAAAVAICLFASARAHRSGKPDQ